MRRNPLLMTVMGNPRHPSRASVEARLDREIEQAYYRHAQGVQVSVMDIPKIFRDVKLEMAAGADVDTAIKIAIAKYRVNANPCSYQENPFILIDSQTNKIIRTWRGSMTDRKPWDWAADAARRLGRSVFVVAHPYVPSTFRAGVEVSPLFFFGGPFQEVRPDGSTGPGPAGGYKKNPSIMAGAIGGMAGALVTNALSNPTSRRARAFMSKKIRQLIREGYPQKQAIAIAYSEARRLGMKANPMTRGEVADTLRSARHDLGYATKPAKGKADRDARRFYAGRAVGKAWAAKMHGPFDHEPRGAEAVFRRGYRYGMAPNPSPRLKAGDKAIIANAVGRLHVGMSDQAVEAFVRGKIKRPPSQGLLVAAIRYAIEVHHKNQGLYRKVQSGRFSTNPGRRTRTIPIAQFAKMIRAQNDRKLWDDFVKKVRGYHKWTHGTWPESVTLEAVRKPGVSGIWITYAIGKTPESTYLMPGGAKRKGAWKHRWERMPEMKGDPEAGVILTKLSGKNRLTNFMHG